jgi:hypothetical protein
LNGKVLPSSFRDPSGFVFKENDALYRAVAPSYQSSYNALLNSGLYELLVKEGKLIQHEEVNKNAFLFENVWKVIRPLEIPFIAYPYEWCFGQLKDAALLTLQIAQTALRFGMCLKDASAYNIQFLNGRPVLIDTLSFEKYEEGRPWVAYRQFCQHFLAPLFLMSQQDPRLNGLLRVHLDGIPLDLASRLLPLKSRFSFSALSHIHLHSRSQKILPQDKGQKKKILVSRQNLTALLSHLESSVKKLKCKTSPTVWSDYYENNSYSAEAMNHKKEWVAQILEDLKPKTVWDLGANDGTFSRLVSGRGIHTVSFDSDAAVVEKNYNACVKKGTTNLLPLRMDLTNPSPALGWAHEERDSLIARGPCDLAMALALVHHLAIANNLPISKIAEFLSRICRFLIIEFVPKEDSQTRRLLASREDIFSNYTKQNFEEDFTKYFSIVRKIKLKNSERVLYLMERIAQ